MSTRISTRALAEHQGKTLQGTFMLTECTERPCSSGATRLQVVLEDSEGSVLGFVWPEHRPFIGAVSVPAPVEVHADVRLFDSKSQLNIRQMNALNVDAVECAAELLPLRQCPVEAQVALSRLGDLERSLPDPLRGFLRRILLDPAIGVPFLRCRASASHHHAQVGGLLIHSTSVLDIAANLARWALPEDGMAPAMAQLGYLLHDLGKLRSVGESRRPLHGLVVRHEIHSLLMLAPHLSWLESRDAGLAAAMQYILQFVATPAKARGWAKYLVAEFVVTLDTWSAAGHNGRDLASLLFGVKDSLDPAVKTSVAANDARYSEKQHAR